MSETRRPLTATPTLERLLSSLRGRLMSAVWLHGLGTILLVAAIWIAYSFLADWGLRVPRLIRILHGLAVPVLLVVFFRRDLVLPRRRVPGRAGLAVLLERAHPDLREVLVSAVQFQTADAGKLRADGAAPDLVRLVLEEADGRSRELAPDAVVAVRRPRTRFLLGLGAAAVLALFAFSNPLHARIFADHLLGGTEAWPQRTHLEVDIAELDEAALVNRGPEEISARVARGTDVPVIVRMRGVVPDELFVHFESGRDLIWSTGGRSVLRRLLPSLQQDTTFWITGGDDEDGLPRVTVEVLQPPDVEGLAIRVQPPAYTALPETTVFDDDVEVLAGSRLKVFVRPFPETATGVARLMPSDVVVELTPEAFPGAPGLPDEETARGLAFELAPEETVGFRIELVDDTGLSNPDPGLYRIKVVDDRLPEVQIISPARTETEAVPGGAIPLRVRAEDDFGLASLSWTVRPASIVGDEEPVSSGGELSLSPLGEETAASEGGEPEVEESAPLPRTAMGGVRLEVDALGGEGATVAVDQRFELEVLAVDNREPEPGTGRALPVRVRIVTPDELLRRMQERLGKARLEAVRLSDLQQEKRSRVEDLLDAAESGGLSLTDGASLVSAVSGQRRVLGDARALGRDLAAVCEDILYARIDDKAIPLLEFYDERVSGISDVRFHPQPWRDLAAAHRDGRLGAGGFASLLVELVDLDLEISEVHALAAAEALDRAEQSLETPTAADELVQAIEHMTTSLARMDDLLEKLAEWDNFQNILSLTRDILNRQRSLRERTEQLASDDD